MHFDGFQNSAWMQIGSFTGNAQMLSRYWQLWVISLSSKPDLFLLLFSTCLKTFTGISWPRDSPLEARVCNSDMLENRGVNPVVEVLGHLPLQCSWHCEDNRIIEPSRLEKTFSIIKSNHQPELPSPISKPCPIVPCANISSTPPQIETPPLLWEAHSNAYLIPSLKKFFLMPKLKLPCCNVRLFCRILSATMTR